MAENRPIEDTPDDGLASSHGVTTPSPTEYAAVRQALEKYIRASYEGDVPALREVFHPMAPMAGYLDGELYLGPPEPWYDELIGSPSPKAAGEEYAAEIAFIHIAGQMASAGLVECGLQGLDYVGHFQLLEIEGEWRIVAKAYTTTG